MVITVDTVIRRLTEPAGPLESTADTLKSGRPDAEVRKVAVMFLATYTLIKRAIDAGADMIVTHEPTYYFHTDQHDWGAGDPVFEQKRALIEQSGIAIFRLHDYIHRYTPDGILAGMVQQLDWEAYTQPEQNNVFSFPPNERHTVGTVAAHLKTRLGVDSLQIVGQPDMSVVRFGLLPGATGGRRQIGLLQDGGIDLLIVGEINEWETSEYVRDANDMGLRKALIVIGHQKSEEAGMITVVETLRQSFPSLPVEFMAGPAAAAWI